MGFYFYFKKFIDTSPCKLSFYTCALVTSGQLSCSRPATPAYSTEENLHVLHLIKSVRIKSGYTTPNWYIDTYRKTGKP